MKTLTIDDFVDGGESSVARTLHHHIQVWNATEMGDSLFDGGERIGKMTYEERPHNYKAVEQAHAELLEAFESALSSTSHPLELAHIRRVLEREYSEDEALAAWRRLTPVLAATTDGMANCMCGNQVVFYCTPESVGKDWTYIIENYEELDKRLQADMSAYLRGYRGDVWVADIYPVGYYAIKERFGHCGLVCRLAEARYGRYSGTHGFGFDEELLPRLQELMLEVKPTPLPIAAWKFISTLAIDAGKCSMNLLRGFTKKGAEPCSI